MPSKWMVAAALAVALEPSAAVAAGQAAPPTEAKPEAKSTGKVGEKMPAFTAKVVRAQKTVDFDSTKTGKVTVYLLVGVKCPATNPYSERLCALEAAYMPKNVDFVYLYVNVPETAAEKAKFHKDQKFAGAFLNDEKSEIAKKLDAQRTGEAIIADKDGKVLYRGG